MKYVLSSNIHMGCYMTTLKLNVLMFWEV